MKKAKNIFLLLALSLGFLTLSSRQVAVADESTGQASYWDMQVGMEEIGHSFGEDSKKVTDVRVRVVKIINIALTIIGILVVVLIIFAGFRWMTAAGNEDTVKKAQGILKNAIIGLLIIILAWSISRFILVRLEAIARNSSKYLQGK